MHENQRVVINVVNLESPPAATTVDGALPEWCDVYAGLTEEEIDRLDHATKRRLDLRAIHGPSSC